MATKIAWTEETWNPIVGCSKVSPGCQSCYAEKMAKRLAHMETGGGYYSDLYRKSMKASHSLWDGSTVFVESALSKPLHWKKPRKIFVCSMGDLFHESVPFEWIDKVFAVMALCPQHTFQVLTKRAERMKEYFDWRNDKDAEPVRTKYYGGDHSPKCHKLTGAMYDIIEQLNLTRSNYTLLGGYEYLTANVWLGVTAENQEMADKRIPILLQTPAAKRFVSVEPMLGAVDLGWACFNGADSVHSLEGLDWVIVGAESGAGRRKCKCIWPTDLVAQCKQANVPVFVKQLHAIGDGLKLIKDPVGWPREFPKEQTK